MQVQRIIFWRMFVLVDNFESKKKTQSSKFPKNDLKIFLDEPCGKEKSSKSQVMSNKSSEF